MSTSAPQTPRLTGQRIWRELESRSFAVLSHVTPAGAPRSTGVVYTIDGHHMYVIVAKDSWKARHIAAGPHVSVTVPIRRGGPLSLVVPIPPATVSFSGEALVRTGEILSELPELAAATPPERRADCAVLEIRPTGHYLTYGLGVPLLRMRDPSRSRARVPVVSDEWAAQR